MGSGLWCREKFQKFLTWAETEPKMAVFPVSCAQPTGKSFKLHTSGTNGECTLRWGAFWGSKTSNVGTQSHKKNSSILSDIEKFAESSGVIIFQIQTEMHFHQRTWHMCGSRPFVIHKIHHNSSYIVRISRTPNPWILISSINLFSPSCLT